MRQHMATSALLPDKAAIQLNDTHPAIAVAELMRILVDLHELPWDEAWRITNATISYTNHTLLPEALESWPVSLMERLLPRHMQIVYQINRLHLDAVCALPRPDAPPLAAVSLIDDNAGRRVRMGSLAFLGSHKVNGVSALHTELMRQTVFRDLHQLYPDRIVNKTNGITFRRWLFAANPRLTGLLTRRRRRARAGRCRWRWSDFAAVADDTALHERLAAIRRANKAGAGAAGGGAAGHHARSRRAVRCAHQAHPRVQAAVAEHPGDDRAVQRRCARSRRANWVPRVKIFAGKAAASYHRAKLIIKLINDVAHVVNNDPALRGLLKVVFMPGLQCQPGGGDHSGRRSVGADLHRRAWRRPAPAT